MQRSGNSAYKCTSRLTKGNWRKASLIRRHTSLGLLRIYIVGMRYFDRGAGGFMAGGELVYEGRIVCERYPQQVGDSPKTPEIRSKAGWGSKGNVTTTDGTTITLEDWQSHRSDASDYNKEFWTIDKAIDYANGSDDGEIGKDTIPVKVTWTKAGYRIRDI